MEVEREHGSSIRLRRGYSAGLNTAWLREVETWLDSLDWLGVVRKSDGANGWGLTAPILRVLAWCEWMGTDDLDSELVLCGGMVI